MPIKLLCGTGSPDSCSLCIDHSWTRPSCLDTSNRISSFSLSFANHLFLKAEMPLLSSPSTFGGLLHKIVTWIVLAFLCSTVIRFILLLDLNKRVYNHTPGPCRAVRNINNGSAGLEILTEMELIFVTTGVSRAKGVENVKSGLYVYDLKGQQTNSYVAKRVKMENFDAKNFAPFGVSSYASKGRVTLYVVNVMKNCVEIFTFNREKMTATHRKSVCDERFTSLQDIVVIGADRFFVSNNAYFRPGWKQTVEMALQFSLGSLYLFDGHTVSTALSHLPSPSGLAVDKKKGLLYVGSLLSEMIKVYSISRDLSLQPKTEITLLSSPLGIHVDEESGEVWATMHPVLFSSFLHSQNPGDKRMRSPSQVLRIRMQEDGASWVVTEPYANDGATLSASASVLYFKEQLFIGSMYGRLLQCDVINPSIT